MNLSGNSLPKGAERESEKIIVIHDDLDLPLGEMKIIFNRGDGGHKGVRDIIQKLKSKNFIQIKIGVCPASEGKCFKPEKNHRNHYLTARKFTKKEWEKIEKLAPAVADALEIILKSGVEKAMNKFN